MHYKGGRGLAMATLGWSRVATAKRNYWLGIGDYHGRLEQGRNAGDSIH